MYYYYAAIICFILGILCIALTIYKFKKSNFYTNLFSIFLCLILFLLACPTMIDSYNLTQSYKINTSYLNRINFHELLEHAELLLDNGFEVIPEKNLQYGYPAVDYQKGYQNVSDEKSVAILIYIRGEDPTLTKKQKVDSYMTVQYKPFFDRLLHKPRNQRFRLRITSDDLLIVFDDNYESKDYPERIYQEIDALADVFPSDAQS